MVPTLEQNAYQRYLKDFALLQDKLGTYQQQDATDYQRYLDAYNKQLQTEQTEYDRAMTLYKLLGYATPEVAEILGIPASNGGGYVSYGTRPVDVDENEGESRENAGIDLKSFLDLGYGPISANRLNNLILSGAVEEYTEGNAIKFRNTGTQDPGTQDQQRYKLPITSIYPVKKPIPLQGKK